jgi:hypothetical protein
MSSIRGFFLSNQDHVFLTAFNIKEVLTLFFYQSDTVNWLLFILSLKNFWLFEKRLRGMVSLRFLKICSIQTFSFKI